MRHLWHRLRCIVMVDECSRCTRRYQKWVKAVQSRMEQP